MAAITQAQIDLFGGSTLNLGGHLLRAVSVLALSLILLVVSLALSIPRSYAATPILVGGSAIVTNTDGDTIRVREGAGAGFAQVAEAHQGEKVEITAGPAKDDAGSSWYRIAAPGVAGWVSAAFLGVAANDNSAGSAEGSTPSLSGYARVANTDGDALRVRSGAGNGGKALGTLSSGSVVKITGAPTRDAAGAWWYQVTGDSVAGWAMSAYLVQSSKPVQLAQPVLPPAPRSGVSKGSVPLVSSGSSDKGSVIASVGLRYVGYRYVFGGASPRGFDCSGFIYYVLGRSGVSVSRDLYSQLNSGSRVNRSNLMPGDLLFWSNTYKRGLSHSGIYIGNGKFVHAENEGTGVVVSSMSSPYYASRFTAAVRPR